MPCHVYKRARTDERGKDLDEIRFKTSRREFA